MQQLLSRLASPDAPPFAILHRGTHAEILIGAVTRHARLADLPSPDASYLALIPFRQITERGFDCHDDGTPLLALQPTETHHVDLATLLEALPDDAVHLRDGRFTPDDESYAAAVKRVVTDEIGRGEGANFVIRRDFTGRLADYTPRTALSILRRLLAGERSAYWTFLVHTHDLTLIGASPEAHVRMAEGTVRMNPISGTYRYPPTGPDRDTLLDFLDDPKEREELSMVVDEELKMMCDIGFDHVVGPRLKPMAHLAHTEYELVGRTDLDVREVLRRTMFAATVTGSPLRNACRVIARHEEGGRGYYAGALALVGRDAAGRQTLDSPIIIRAAHVRADGGLRVPVGATLVRGSSPDGEVAETSAKAAAVLGAVRAVRVERGVHAAGDAEVVASLAETPEVRQRLATRRDGLAPFWLGAVDADRSALAGTDILVVDAEDSFTAMLARLLRALGARVRVIGAGAAGLRQRVLAHAGPIVLGPGPGDPRDTADPRMSALRGLARELLRRRTAPVLGVCLGHELLAIELGLPLVRRDAPRQGEQLTVDLFGERETVGFYNTFAARAEGRFAARGVEVARHAGEVVALRARAGVAGVQFHPESVLTLRGPRLLAALLR